MCSLARALRTCVVQPERWAPGRSPGRVVSSFMAHPNGRTIPLELIEKLPKTDLHVHLDGSLRLSTILELAERQSIELPARDADGLRTAMHLGRELRLARRVPQGVRRHAARDADRGVAPPHRLRARRGRRARERPLHGGALRADAAHAARPQADDGGRERARGAARGAGQARHRVERHHLRHPQRLARELARDGGAGGRVQGPRRRGVRPRRARSTTTRPSTTRRPSSSFATTTST